MASKLLHILLKNGSLADIVGSTVGTNTGCTFVDSEKGHALDFGTADEVNGYGAVNSVLAIAFVIKPTANTKLFLDDGTDRLEIAAGNYSGTGLTECTVFETVATDTDAATLNRWQLVIAEFSGGINFSTDFEVDVTAATQLAGDIILFDAVPTASEKNQLYTEFVADNRPCQPQIRNFRDSSVEINTNETGLTSAFQFTGINQVDADLVDGSAITKVDNPVRDGDNGYNFNGTTQRITIGNKGNVRSIHMRGKLQTTSEELLEGDPNAHLIYANAGTLTYPDFDNAFINGADTNTITAGAWYDIFVVSSTDVNMTAIELALNNAAYGQFQCQFVKFYSDEKDLAYAQSSYNNWATQILLNLTFEGRGADGITKNIQDITPGGTATYFIGESDGTDGLPFGTPYLEIVGGGTILIDIPSLSDYVSNGYFNRLYYSSGAAFADVGGDTVDNVVTAQAWLALSGNRFTATLNAGDAISLITIQKGGNV